MAEIFHSVALNKDKCKGCINCIKRCPTKAIRVRDGKAHIISERCIDCGECIRVCNHRAKKAITDSLDSIKSFKYKIALIPPSLYGQFNNLNHPDYIVAGLKKIGFDEVFDVSRAAELISDATRRMLDSGELQKPVISSACPAVLRLIRARFPELIGRVLPIVAPVELAAQMAKDEAQAKGVAKEDIACIFLTPCPAKVTAMKTPIGSLKSEIDAAIAIKDVYPLLVNAMVATQAPNPPQAGSLGIGWAESGGEAAGLLHVDNYLAADGIENVIAVLEDLEDNKYSELEFVELHACPAGCVGGVLQVENPYIAKAKLKKMRRNMPKVLNSLQADIPEEMFWDDDLKYSPVMQLGKTKQESFEKFAEVAAIVEKLPGLDCGSCGSPSCESFAEDVVRGYSALSGCVVLMRQRMEAILKAAGLDK